MCYHRRHPSSPDPSTAALDNTPARSAWTVCPQRTSELHQESLSPLALPIDSSNTMLSATVPHDKGSTDSSKLPSTSHTTVSNPGQHCHQGDTCIPILLSVQFCNAAGDQQKGGFLP